MTKIKYDTNLIKLISLFETLTRSKVKDCIESNILMFVVKRGEIGKAIGKKGSNIKRIENVLKRKIKIVEFNDDIEIFVKNLIAPIKVENITKEDDTIIISDANNQTKGRLKGRDSQNLKEYKKIVSRYFDIKDIIVK